MKIIETKIDGVLILEPNVFGDERGYFMETWQVERYAEAGLPKRFVQDNISSSSKGVLRGLHFQNPHTQGKLVSALQGEVFDVAVDIRVGSPTFGQWVGVSLSAENKRQFYVPEGFAHGFCVTSDTALFSYKCTDFYHHPGEYSLLWNDPDVGIEWPMSDVSLSGKDESAVCLKDFPVEQLPVFEK
jgi:dTDP-4-dehydrorhamnose 3,5-epimerase